MNHSIVVRPARAKDKDAVIAFCQNTFSWGDYIADAWDGWMTDLNGRLIVGLVDAKPVGLAHVRILEEGVGWMEGMRVHPDFRRHGVSTALDNAGHAFARARGCRVARLVTSIKNLAAQKTIATQGYHRIVQFNEWGASRLSGARARIAVPADADHIFETWARLAVSHQLLPNRDWSWTRLARARVKSEIAASQARVVEGGWMFLHASDEADEPMLMLHALVGDADTARALALAARAEAEYRGYARVEATVAEDASLNRALKDAGYQRDGGVLIYEQNL